MTSRAVPPPAPPLEASLASERLAVERRLSRLLSAARGDSARLDEAVAYALLGGGKRLRAVLCLWVYDALRPRRTDAVWRCAAALEMLHAYSLVHDDLPAMDDDDLRRGRPSCHRKFDEATAILAGDALQTEAFGVLAAARPAVLGSQLVAILAAAAGRQGMAAGQQLDLESEREGAAPGGGGAGAARRMRQIHRLKTGRLMGAAVALGAACGGLSGDRVQRARAAGETLGVAFQIADDLLDESSTAAQLGKTAGKDRAQGKLTAPAVLGSSAAARAARRGLDDALAALGAAVAPRATLPSRLVGLTQLLVERAR
jgi:farnesyl diphosphate synthase